MSDELFRNLVWVGAAFGIVVLVMALEFVFRNMFNSKAVDAPQVFNRNR